MFNLFALVKDDDNRITPDSLIHDLQEKFAWAHEYQIEKEDLQFPQTTVVNLNKPDWHVRISIRPDEDMTLDTGELHKILHKKTTLPDDFLTYNTEIAIGFADDPEERYTDDIINLGEFIRDNYPGVVIFDQYNLDVW